MVMMKDLRFLFVLLFPLLTLPSTEGANVTLDTVECDSSLDVYAYNVHMSCGNDADDQLTFGNRTGCRLGDTVYLTAGVTYSGLSSQVAYVTLIVSKAYQDFAVYAGEQISLCNNVHSNNGKCYEDGDYTFSLKETLPTFGDKDWFLTGLSMGAKLRIYADAESSILLGECSTSLRAVPTASSAPLGTTPPSAVTFFTILAIMIGLFLLVTAYCCYVTAIDERKLRGGKSSDYDTGDSRQDFVRMESGDEGDGGYVYDDDYDDAVNRARGGSSRRSG